MMNHRQYIGYLRSKAAEFRKLAIEYEMVVTATLLEIAEQLDATAAELDQRPYLRRVK